jgi:dTDP-4-dehydrorhamnose reductase
VEAERRIIDCGVDAAILRISLVYGRSPSGVRSPVEQIARAVEAGRTLRFFEDEYRCPIAVEDVESAVCEMIPKRDVPLLHLAGPDRVNRVAFGRAILDMLGLKSIDFEIVKLAESGAVPPRPPDLSLDTALARRVLDAPPRSISAGLAHLASTGPTI